MKYGGRRDDRLYDTWWKMRRRCENPNDKKYANYGGRGITVAREWQDYSAFFDWAVANGYQRGLSIERTDNDKGYCASNCRWATAAEQALNTTRVRRRDDGTPWIEIARANGINKGAFHGRLYGRGWSLEQAATTPLGARS